MNVDAMIGQVMATLEKLKLKENTLIFFSSDNGPVWYPQDIEKFGHRAAGPWNGMKGALTDAGHHMPFIASWPGKIQAGSTCGELICFTDMMATLASLLGEKLPNDAGEDSFDISPLLRGEKPAKPIRNGMVHVNYGSYTLAIREGDWKLILPAWRLCGEGRHHHARSHRRDHGQRPDRQVPTLQPPHRSRRGHESLRARAGQSEGTLRRAEGGHRTREEPTMKHAPPSHSSPPCCSRRWPRWTPPS